LLFFCALKYWQAHASLWNQRSQRYEFFDERDTVAAAFVLFMANYFIRVAPLFG